MARKWLTPISTCVLTESGSVKGSEGAYAWFGLTANADNAACAAFYGSGSVIAERELWAMAADAKTSAPMCGPFAAPCGVCVAVTGTGASALVALNKEPQ